MVQSYLLKDLLALSHVKGADIMFKLLRPLLEQNSQQEFAAFECKWGMGKAKVPVAFEKSYPDATWTKIDKTNYLDWTLGQAG